MPTSPLLRALLLLVQDLASTLLFVAILALTNRLGLAIGAGIAIGLIEIAIQAARRRPIHRMQWLSLFLVIAFGGTTLLTGNPIFAMLKPAMIYAAIALVLLSPGWMNQYAPTTARGVDLAALNRVFGFIWAAVFAAIAAASLALALLARPVIFGWFVLVVPIAAKCALIAIQYAATRRFVRSRLTTPLAGDLTQPP